MSETNEETPQATPLYIESGNYEYSYDTVAHRVQIYSTRTMSSTFHTAQEALDLLHLLQSYQASIEEAAMQQAAQKPRKKTTEERIDDLFH